MNEIKVSLPPQLSHHSSQGEPMLIVSCVFFINFLYICKYMQVSLSSSFLNTKGIKLTHCSAFAFFIHYFRINNQIYLNLFSPANRCRLSSIKWDSPDLLQEFNNRTIDRYLGCFQSFSFVHDAARNFLVDIFQSISARIISVQDEFLLDHRTRVRQFLQE